jgi:hypothetical protein
MVPETNIFMPIIHSQFGAYVDTLFAVNDILIFFFMRAHCPTLFPLLSVIPANAGIHGFSVTRIHPLRDSALFQSTPGFPLSRE